MPMLIVPPGLAGAAAPPEGVTAAEVELDPDEAADELEELEPQPAASAATTTADATTPQNRAERESEAEVGLLLLIDHALLGWVYAVC